MATRTRGALPDLVFEGFQRDRNGLISGRVKVYHKLLAKPEVISLDWLTPTFAPNVNGLPVVGSQLTFPGGGIAEVIFSYEGAPAGYTPLDQDITFDFDTTMSEDPIQTHPAWKQLKVMYAWNDTDKQFAETLTSKNTTGNALTSSTAAGTPSPLFGTDTWLVIGGTFRKTYTSTEIPADILQDIGTIVAAPPGISGFKMPTGGKRNWLKIAPTISRTGNAVKISESWLLSGPKGWATPVYSKAQLGIGGF